MKRREPANKAAALQLLQTKFVLWPSRHKSRLGKLRRWWAIWLITPPIQLNRWKILKSKLTWAVVYLHRLKTTFIQIAHYIDGVAGAIQDFSASLNDMNEMSTSVSAATQEQAASMGEIALNTDRLAGLGKELQEIATRFTL